jgi:hypothetical protein
VVKPTCGTTHTPDNILVEIPHTSPVVELLYFATQHHHPLEAVRRY